MRHLSTLPILTLLLSPTHSLAQSGPSGSTPPPFVLFDTSSPETEQKALEAHQAGKAAHKDGKLEKARELLEQAYALSPNWKRAADLALVEIALERFREAAEHLDFFLNHADRDAVPDEIFTKFSEYFDLAKSHIAAITVTVDEPGAEVWLDGKSIGFSPFIPVVYAKPGKHTISAKKTGFPTEKSEIDVIAGSSPRLKLNLKQVNVPAPEQQPLPPSTGLSSQFDLSTPIPAIISGGLALIGLGLGAGFGVSAYYNQRDARSLQFEIYDIRDELASDTHPGPTSVQDLCKDPSVRLRCERYSQLSAKIKRDNIISTVGLTVGGVAAAGTAMLLAIHLFSEKPPSSNGEKDSAFSPILTASHQGIQWSGTF